MNLFPQDVMTVLLCCFFSAASNAQYNAHEAFAPIFYTQNGNSFRSASGKPNEKYWQNKADYTIRANFDTTTMILQGTAELTYTNNSPDNLNCLWFELDQNANNGNTIGNILNGKPATLDNKGFTIASVSIWNKDKWQKTDYSIYDTRMQVRLANKIPANTISKIKITYSYPLIASGGGGRSGYRDFQGGRIYAFSYWYPRVCVYDDVYGWNTLPFVGSGEMYMDYGDIDYAVTVPSNQVVVGTGALANATAILNSKIWQRLQAAAQSDKTVFIRKADEINTPVTQKTTGNTTWHFKMGNTRDVAWAMSASYIWDAARINLPDGKNALAQSVYPDEATQDGRAWVRATEFLKFSVEHFSEKWFPFPYPVASNVAGPVGGMEYPGLAFDDWDAQPYDMFLLASHEIGHTWFPMIVGSDERRNAFMDEGFNTFIDIFAHDDFNHGEFAPKRDGEYAPGKGNPADEVAKVIAQYQNGPTLMTYADAQDYQSVHPLSYFKSAFGLILLRNIILGKEKFDYAFRQYIQDWAFKHPKPEDFFRSMENNAGEDLTWFWRGWYYNNWQTDQAITNVAYNQNNPANGGVISIENKDKLPLPVPVLIKEKNGQTHSLQLPVEIWQRGSQWKFAVATTSEIVSVELDPNHQIPDRDRSNNKWGK